MTALLNPEPLRRRACGVRVMHVRAVAADVQSRCSTAISVVPVSDWPLSALVVVVAIGAEELHGIGGVAV
jgi:hypothetical protein